MHDLPTAQIMVPTHGHCARAQSESVLHVSDIVVFVIIVILSSQIVASWYHRILSALANNYETVPSSPSFLPRPLSSCP